VTSGRRASPLLAATVAIVTALMVTGTACGTGRAVYDLAPPARPGQPAGTVLLDSGSTVAATTKRLQDAITRSGGTVGAVVDHSADAKAVGVTLPANTVVIGGSATAQDPLLRVDQGAGATLPGRYLVRAGADGTATVLYDGADYLAAVSGVATPGTARALTTETTSVAAAGAGVTAVPLAAPLLGVTPTGFLVVTPGESEVPATVARLRRNVDRPSTVVATIDLAAGSATPGPALRPTVELLVSTPEAEAPLIAAAPSFGLEMPMRFVVWQDDKQITQIAYPDVRVLAARHGIPATDPNVVRLAADAARLAKVAAGKAA